MPESLYTHQNASSVELLETRLILGLEENCKQTLGVLFIVVTIIGCSLVVIKSLYCVVQGYKMQLQGGYWRAGKILWCLYQWL